MEKHSIIICILLAIITTNLIRVVPMLLIKGQISNRFLRSFLYYGLAPSGTFPRRRHLLHHRLSDRHPDHLIQKCQFYILLRFRFWITRRILLPLQAEMTNTVISRKTVII